MRHDSDDDILAGYNGSTCSSVPPEVSRNSLLTAMQSMGIVLVFPDVYIAVTFNRQEVSLEALLLLLQSARKP